MCMIVDSAKNYVPSKYRQASPASGLKFKMTGFWKETILFDSSSYEYQWIRNAEVKGRIEINSYAASVKC